MIRRTITVATVSAIALAGCSSSSGGGSASSGAAKAGGSGTSSASAQAVSLGAPQKAQCSPAPAGDTPAAKGENSPVMASSVGRGYGHPETDVRSENLDLTWDGTTLSGTATIEAAATKPTSTLGLDLAPQLTVGEVSVDGHAVATKHVDHVLTIPTGSMSAGQTRKIVVTYTGTPHSVPAPSMRGDMGDGLGWNEQADGSVTTYAEPYGNSAWAPFNETPSDKALFSTTVHTKAPAVGVVNGAMCEVATKDGRTSTSWHAAEPMAAYLVSLNIGAYREYDIPVNGRTARVYAQEKDAKAVEALRTSLPWAVDWMTKRVGPYPFQQLDLVVTQGQNGMETQGLISIGVETLMSQNRSVVLHELAHQWFGDLVTPEQWKDLWLNEGAAMFVQFQGSTEKATDDLVLRACRASAQRAGQVESERPGHFAENGPYLCGALAFSELRDQIGDTAFWKAFGGWPRSTPFGTATREDFAAYWQKATGHDPRPTLAKWLDHVSPDTTTSTHVVAHPAPSPEASTSSASAPSASSPSSSSSSSTP